MKRISIALLMVFCIAGTALAVNPDERLADPALEERARIISKDLRCLVCQNQSIDDSDADLARDLRVLVRERLVEGDSNQDVVDYIVDRYGEFVLLRPKFGLHTALLWGLPIVLLLGGFVIGWSVFRRRENVEPSIATSVSDDEKAALDELRG